MATGTARATARIGASNLMRQSSGEQAAFYIRKLIFDGDLKPGQRVPQDDIAEALGVSRIPLREALIALEREGWVTVEIHRGAFVNALSAEIVDDHFELFSLIYGFAIRRALQRSGDEFIEEMAVLQSELAATTDPAKAGELIFSVFRTIVDYARSPRLRVVLRAISTLVPGDFFETVPVAIDVERKSINTLVRALRRRDGDKAADEFRRMLRRVSKEVTQLFRDRGLFDVPDDGANVGA